MSTLRNCIYTRERRREGGDESSADGFGLNSSFLPSFFPVTLFRFLRVRFYTTLPAPSHISIRSPLTRFVVFLPPRDLQRAKHSPSSALSFLQTHLLFRLAHQVDLISLPSLSTQYPEAGLFYFLPFEMGVKDRLGRPVAVLNMRQVRRTEDGSLIGLKENVL